MCIVFCFFFFALSSPCLPSLLSFLSLGVCYFSPVIRHADSSLSPSNTTKINFPALSHVGGHTSGHTCTCISFTHTFAETPAQAYMTHTHTHTLAGDSPLYCFLTCYLLHLCNIHLSSLTGPGSSIYPSIPLPSLRQPTPLLSTATSSQTSSPFWTHSHSLFFCAFWKKEMEFFACEWLLFWCGVLEVCQTLCTRAAKRWSVISVSKDSVWWIVKEDSAQDGVWWRIT